MRALAILTTLLLAGCSASPLGISGGRNDFKGQPLSAVQVRLGPPDQEQIIEGRKIYSWFKGQSLNPCIVRVAMAGDVVDAYETTGDAGICSPWDRRPG